MADKTNANIGFEKQLWDAACVLWGHIPAAEYRKVIIGLIFLRYISAAFDKRYQELVEEGDGFEDDIDAYTMENVFLVTEEARWNTIAAAAHTPEIGTVIDNAMRAIEADNKALKGVLPKNYASPDLDKRVLGEVVDIFTNNIDMSNAEVSADLLGRTYEYCIAQFAAYEGVKGGEFYTPASVVKTLVEVLEPLENCRVYDPCCGSGGMFVQSVNFLRAHNGRRGTISVYGQESNPDTWKMAKMNMAIRGIEADFGPYHADTFTNDLHPTMKADYILANPPFNFSNWGQESLIDDVRWKYGLPPASNANFAWIQHMIHHLSPNGKMGLVLANTALSINTGEEYEIRKKIIEDNLVEAIVSLPAQLFYSTKIRVSIWFINKQKHNTDILFIDTRKLGHMISRTMKEFSDADIMKIADYIHRFQNGEENIDTVGFCKKATIDEVRNKKYNISPSKYITGSIEAEDIGEYLNDKGEGKKISLPEMNARVNALLEQSIKSSGVINLFSDVDGEFSLFDPKFLEEIGKMKEKNLAVELLKKLISEQVIIYKRTNVVKSAKFSEIIQQAMNRYLNGMLTNEQVIEELLNLAKQIQTAQQEGQKLGLTADELAFYDALTKPQAIMDFYENEELIAITKELADALRKNKTIDWQKRDSARAKMRMLIKKLLKKHKYPPEGMDDAAQTVMLQCELWTDNNDMMEERVSNYASRLSEYVSEINK